METEIRIQVPEGMEIDKENSTFECIKFKPKEITYQEIAKKFQPYNSSVSANAKHLLKLITFRKLLEVADYLNSDWKPDWNDENQYKYYISYDGGYETFFIDNRCFVNQGVVYFSSKENALKAIEIIGKEELKQFFS
jgi:hypothetical protein